MDLIDKLKAELGDAGVAIELAATLEVIVHAYNTGTINDALVDEAQARVEDAADLYGMRGNLMWERPDEGRGRLEDVLRSIGVEL